MLCLYYPQQLLPGLAAVLSFRAYKGESAVTPLTVLVWAPSSITDETRKKRLQAFTVLLEDFRYTNLCIPQPCEINNKLSQNIKVAKKANYLRQKFSTTCFDAIYYAHDISADFIAQSAMQAFPDAERVCFGDGLGIFYSNDYFTDMAYPVPSAGEIFKGPHRVLRNLLCRLKRKWTLPSKDRRLDAQYALPILPCDPGGDFLKNKTLLGVDNNNVLHVRNALSASVERHLSKAKLAATTNEKADFVILVGSYTESGLTTEERELALYNEVANLYIAAGSRIALKPHPVSSERKVARIRRELSSNYDVHIMGYGELPIESMPALLADSKVISFSYSSISLLYLYNCKVLHVLNQSLINKYFPADARQWLGDSNKLYLDQLAMVDKMRNVIS